MADLRIVDAPEIPTENITGEEKLPTGGSGNYSITLDSVADYTKTKKDLADNTSVDTKVNGVRQELDTHIEDLLNPHQVTKSQIGLGNVDNTADADKPVSNATQATIISAVSPKADKTYVDTALSSKTDKTYVDSQLTLKANKVDVYTKSETYTKQESSDLVSNSISTALTPVNSSLDLAKRGVANRYDPLLTYNSGERVVLANGDIVKSTVDGNVNDPNVDITGWVKVNHASQIFDGSKSQRSINLSIINYANPKMFGGVGDGITDDAQAIRDCFNYMLANNATFYDYSNSVYKFNSDILVSAPNKRIDIRTNCSFISDTSLFKVSGSITDLGSLTTVAAKGSKSITESFGVSAGDLIAIHNTVNKSFAQHRDYYTDGEFKTVLSVSGGVITFNQPLETSYSGVATDKFYKISPVELHVNGLSVESNGAGAFNLSLAYKCELNNTNVRNLLNATNSNYAAQFDRVVDSKINGGEYIKLGISGTGTDYGIVFANCQDIENRANYVYGGRHAVATGGTVLSASVPCRRIQTLFATLENDPSSSLHAADFHGNTADSFYQNCTIYGRISLSGFNTSSRNNAIYSHADDVRAPIGYGEIVGGVIESVGDTILSTAAASNIAGWLTSSAIVNTVKPTTFKLQDIKFNGNANLIGILSVTNMEVDSRLIVDGFELTDSSNTITRLVTYTAGNSAIKPSYIQITRPNFNVPESVLYIAGGATLTTTVKNVFPSSGTGANGSWIKQSDGSMICRQRVTATLPINTAIAGGFKSTNIAWTLPKTFIAAPSLTAMCFDNSSFAVRAASSGTSAAQLYAINPISIASAGIDFDVIAIGRHLS